MKTKEQILNRYAKMPSKEIGMYDTVSYQGALVAMAEYAQQQTAELRAEVEKFRPYYDFMTNRLKHIDSILTDYSKDAPLKKLKNP